MEATKLSAMRNLINDECIVRVPVGSKELPALETGSFYRWQFYLRSALLNPECLKIVEEDFWSKYEDHYKHQPFQVAGVEAAAIPVLTAIILGAARRGYQLRAFTIRKERKLYGRRNIIEGNPSTDPVLLIDDLTSSQHNSLWHAIHTIGQANLTLRGLAYVVVLKKTAEECRTIDTSLGKIEVGSLFTLSNFTLLLEDYMLEKAQQKLQE